MGNSEKSFSNGWSYQNKRNWDCSLLKNSKFAALIFCLETKPKVTAMLTRRHIRVKVMQSLYALWRDGEKDAAIEKRFLNTSMNDMYELFLLELALLIEVRDHAGEYIEKSRQKYLATEEDRYPNLKFIDNAVLVQVEGNEKFQSLLDKKKLNNWRKEPHYVQIIWDALRQSDLYADYTATRASTFKEDKNFIIRFFKEIVAPCEKIHNYLEDTRITWMDDLPIVNTTLLKQLRTVKPDTPFHLPGLFKNKDDHDFAFELFDKTNLHHKEFEQNIEDQTPNWDKDRLAEIDAVLIKMAISEFIYFPTIPVKVTINEYIEIAKEYSTPKSSIFINGVLDKISKDFEKDGQLNKMGRGLM